MSIGSSNVNTFSDKETLFSDLFTNILIKIEKDENFFSKYTQEKCEKEIKERNEKNKDLNLKVLEYLETEQMNLRNQLTRCGLAQYKDLASDFSDVLEREEQDTLIRGEFMKKDGDINDEDQFQEFKKQYLEQIQIDLDNQVFVSGEDDELDFYDPEI